MENQNNNENSNGNAENKTVYETNNENQINEETEIQRLSSEYDTAIIGIDTITNGVIYDFELVIGIIMKENKISEENAIDYFQHEFTGWHYRENVITPTFIYKNKEKEQTVMKCQNAKVHRAIDRTNKTETAKQNDLIIKELDKLAMICKKAEKENVITDYDYFVKNGMNENIVNFLVQQHYIKKQHKEQNVYINWNVNRKYPNETIKNLKQSLKETK